MLALTTTNLMLLFISISLFWSRFALTNLALAYSVLVDDHLVCFFRLVNLICLGSAQLIDEIACLFCRNFRFCRWSCCCPVALICSFSWLAVLAEIRQRLLCCLLVSLFIILVHFPCTGSLLYWALPVQAPVLGISCTGKCPVQEPVQRKQCIFSWKTRSDTFSLPSF